MDQSRLQRIQTRALELYEKSGRVPGRDAANWAEAEAQIANEVCTAGPVMRKLTSMRIKPSLADYIGRPILIAAPEPFQDTKAHLYELLGIESCGVWLEIHNRAAELLMSEHANIAGSSLIVLIPFSQISAIVLPEIGRTDSSVQAVVGRDEPTGAETLASASSLFASTKPVAKRKRGSKP